MNKQKTRGQLISKLQHIKSQPNGNSIQHLSYKDIVTICDYLLEDKKEIEKLENEKEHLIDEYTEEYEAKGDVEFKLFKTEKALDRACEMLTKPTSDCDIYKCPFGCEYDSCDFECENKEKWKEWCMKDE